MKKVKGKALSLVLSLALVISSFSMIPVSASTKTMKGTLGGGFDTDFYLVNGGTGDALVYAGFGSAVNGAPTMTTPNHKDVSDVKIAAISHKEGNRLVKWYDAGSDGSQTDSIDSETDDADIALQLRSSTVSGSETLAILYKGTYTDDDDNEYTVKAQEDVTIRVYDKNQTVIGNEKNDGKPGCKGELDSSFAQETAAYELDEKADAEHADPKLTDSKDLVVLKAIPDDTNAIVVKWEALKTVAYDKDNRAAMEAYSDGDATNDNDVYYVLKSSSSNVGVGTAGDVANYDYNTTTDIVQEATSATYTMDAVTEQTGTPGFELDSTGTLKVTAPTSGSTSYVTYTTDGTDPDKDSTKIESSAFATGTDISGNLGTPATAVTLKVAAFDSSDTAIGTAASGDVTYTAAIDANDCPTLTQDTSNHAKFAFTKAGSDTGSDWTYDYTVTGGASGATKNDDGSLTLDAATTSAPVVLTVTAKDASGDTKGSTTVTVTTTSNPLPGSTQNYVTAQVATDAKSGSVTFTAEATDYADSKADELDSTKDIKEKSSVDKKIIVDNDNAANDEDSFIQLSKYSTSTYLYKGAVEKGTKEDAIRVSGFEVNFKNGKGVKATDKANVSKISGTVASLNVSDDSSVGSIDLDGTPTVTISDAKVSGTIGVDTGILNVTSTDSSVGEVTDANKVIVTNGTVGNITADDVSVSAQDEDKTVTVGDITSAKIEIDSDNSKVATGTLKATDSESEITLHGDFLTVKAIDFDNWEAELKIDGFTGTIPAPKNAEEDGAIISTNAMGDKVTIDGDADINGIDVGDDSTMTFNGDLNVGSVDGSGTLVVGLGKMNISSDASGVILMFSDPTIEKGATAFTAVTDTVDTDSMDNYGFTLTKSESSKTDTFKIDTTTCVGLTFNPASAEIPKDFSETFKAAPYAPGSALPEGYHVDYTLDGDDDVFTMTKNEDGSVEVKVVGYDDMFAEENKATLTAYVVDANNDIDDDYTAGELDLTALEVPKASYRSDTGTALSLNAGSTYQFKITSLDGKAPVFKLGSPSAFQLVASGNSGDDYFYKVTAVGPVGSATGVYVNGEPTPSTIITITSPYTIDTKTVTKTAGQTYQFKVTGPSQPKFQIGGIGDMTLASKNGNDYFFKVTVPASAAKGTHGVYVNGTVMAYLVVA